MPEGNSEVARLVVDRWAAGDFSSTLEHLAPHAVLVVPREFAEFGIYVGAEEIGEYTRRFMEQFERVAIEAERIREVGDTVLVDVVQHGHGRRSGIDIRTPYYLLMTFRAGKIVRMESVLDESAAVAMAGLGPGS